MKEYYLHDGQQQTGPFSIEELKQKNINQNTQVWKEGMSSWAKAGDIQELAIILSAVPPPFVSPPPYKSANSIEEIAAPEKKKKSSLVFNLVLLAIAITAIALYFINQNSSTEDSPYNPPIVTDSVVSPKSVEEIEEDLGTIENGNPAKYLRVVNFEWRENLLGELVFKGSIVCNSKVAEFKDVVLEAKYISASGTLLRTEKFTRYETFGNGSNITFKYKTLLAPRETKQVEFDVVNAIPLTN